MLISVSIIRQAGFQSATGNVVLSLGDLSDVILTSPQAGDILRFNGLIWENTPGTLPILTPITVFSDYTPSEGNKEIVADASSQEITVQLPSATGSGTWFHVKKIDSTENVVTVAVDGSDLIDDSASVALTDQWSDCLVIDAVAGYWDQVGVSGAP